MEIVGIQPKLDAMTCLEDPTIRKSDLLENGYLGDTLKKVLVGELGACEWVGTESLSGEEAEYRVVASARLAATCFAMFRKFLTTSGASCIRSGSSERHILMSNTYSSSRG